MRTESIGPLFADDNPSTQVGGGPKIDQTRTAPANPPQPPPTETTKHP